MDEYNTLRDVSLQSPYNGGPAVYTARVMLGQEPGNMQQRNQEIIVTDSSGINEKPVFGKPYPNPTNNMINLDYYLPENTEAVFLIYNLNGQLVSRFKLHNEKNTVQIQTSDYTEGLYIYNIIGNGIVYERGKIIVLKSK